MANSSFKVKSPGFSMRRRKVWRHEPMISPISSWVTLRSYIKVFRFFIRRRYMAKPPFPKIPSRLFAFLIFCPPPSQPSTTAAAGFTDTKQSANEHLSRGDQRTMSERPFLPCLYLFYTHYNKPSMPKMVQLFLLHFCYMKNGVSPAKPR